jgi:hypothetical protein
VVGDRLRVVAVTGAARVFDQPKIALFDDQDGEFANIYGCQEISFLVRPDGYIGWRGRSRQAPSLTAYLAMVFEPASTGLDPGSAWVSSTEMAATAHLTHCLAFR